MFVFKKAVVILGALAALAVPAVASADDRVVRRDDHAVVVGRERGAHDRRAFGDHRRWDDRRDDRGRWHRGGYRCR